MALHFCSKCHKKFHNKYGYTRNNQEQLMDFFDISQKAPNGAEAQLANRASNLQKGA